MRMKPDMKLHPNESISAVIMRIHRHIRRLQADYKPKSHYAAKQQAKHARPKLHLVK
jgi:isocitrate lyase